MSKSGAQFNKRLILFTVSTILMIEAVAIIPSAAMGLYDGDMDSFKGMVISAVVLMALGLLGRQLSGSHQVKMKVKESYLIVLLCWLTSIFGGMLPYLTIGRNYRVTDAFFESAATWTTTNAWVIDINSMPRALVLWNATCSWMGGMGIIVLTLIIFSALGVSGQRLAGAEIAGPELEKHTARMADTARLLYRLYGVGSLIELGLLMLAGLPKFDAVINTMSTISTAGTMDYHSGLANHFTPGVKIVIVVFSILASLNFAIYIKVVKKKYKEAAMDFEMHTFLGLILGSTLFIAVVLMVQGYYDNVFDALVNAVTGVVSFSCTTGFTLEHVELWPSVCKIVFIVLMIIGGCATSTAGGIKVIRFAVFVKLIRRGVYKRIHPRAVRPVMIRETPVSTENASSISTFILLFLGVYLMSTLIFSLENVDMETTLTTPIALFTNCGEGFGMISGANYAVFSLPLRVYSALLMILGRLEMYALLILFSRSFWSPNRTK